MTSNNRHGNKSDDLIDSLNGMNMLMTGQGQFDKKFVHELNQCLQQLDPKLPQSINAQWRGFKTYAASGGNPPNDVWKRCTEGAEGKKDWMENNCTVQKYGNIPVWEPCNYASNIGYYHSVTQICSKKQWSMSKESVNAIGKAYASLALGSAFFSC